MIVIFIIHHLMMYIIHFICVFLPGKYKPLLEMKCGPTPLRPLVYVGHSHLIFHPASTYAYDNTPVESRLLLASNHQIFMPLCTNKH